MPALTLCTCPCHHRGGPGYEGHPAPGEPPAANLMIGLIGHNGALAVPAPYCWTCAYVLTMRMAAVAFGPGFAEQMGPAMHANHDVAPMTTAEAVKRMMGYANEKPRT